MNNVDKLLNYLLNPNLASTLYVPTKEEIEAEDSPSIDFRVEFVKYQVNGAEPALWENENGKRSFRVKYLSQASKLIDITMDKVPSIMFGRIEERLANGRIITSFVYRDPNSIYAGRRKRLSSSTKQYASNFTKSF